MSQTGKKDRTEAQLKWEEFSKTGRLGAYLTYRAIAAREERDRS